MNSQAEPWAIPKHWAWARFEDVAEIAQDLVDPSEVLDEPHIAPNHIVSGDRRLLPFSTVREDGVISPKQRFFSGQILFTKIRPYLLKSVLVNFEGVCSADMYPLWAKSNVLPEYLLYWLTSPDFRDEIALQQGRTVLPKINQPALNASGIALPPLPEQRRIVAKMDSLLTNSRRARDQLGHIPRLVENYKQAILAAAFRGELTRRNTDPWKLTFVQDVASAVFDGPFGSNLRSQDYVGAGVRVIRLENIGHLQFIGAKTSFVSQEKYDGLRRHTLEPDDILFSSFVDEQVRVCLFPHREPTEAINKADCFCIRLRQDLCLPAFLNYRLACRSTYETLREVVHGATRPRITLQHLKRLEFELPPLETQHQVVRRIEAAFAWIDRLAREATSARTLIDRLDQAVLAKAFRGELVPQDPSDEPASVLLERVRAERAEKPAARERRGRRASA